jgi:membrane-associated protease RseP (regulator of RpoE activity)
MHLNNHAPAMVTRSSQGYLGVGVREVAEDQTNSFHVPPSRGLEIVVVDHDAPAAKAGLKEHDIILRANGETVENVEKFRRMVRETPPGHLLALIISRAGREVTIPVKVADRAEVEKQAWSQHTSVIPESDMDMSWVAPQKIGPTVPGSGFFATMTAPSYYTGVIVDALGPQLASFFGAQTGLGLLVKSVDANSPAANAGIKAGDVIVKVGQTQMATRNDFYHAVREHKGKQVTVTLLRDKKEQTVTLNVGEGKNTKSCLDVETLPEIVELQEQSADAANAQVAQLQPEIEKAIANAQAQVGPQMEQMQVQMKELEPRMREDMQRAQAEVRKIEPQLREQMKHLQEDIQPKIQEQMKSLQDIRPQIELQMKQLENIHPQIELQMKDLQNIQPKIELQMKDLQERLQKIEPQLHLQLQHLQEMQRTPLI